MGDLGWFLALLGAGGHLSINAGASSNLETRVMMENERARIVVDARDSEGEFLNGLLLNSAVLDPSGDSRRIPLQQTAPGRYETTFNPQTEGAYFLNIHGSAQLEDQEMALTDLNGWVMSYSPEYIPREQDARLLAQIADITGGSNLGGTPTDVFSHNLGERQAKTAIWESLVWIALILLPFDIAVRRLIITRSDLNRLRAWLSGQPSEAEARSPRLETLLDVRQRSRESTGYGEAGLMDAVGRRQPVSFDAEPKDDDLPPTPPASAPPAADNLGARLLQRRKKRRHESDE